MWRLIVGFLVTIIAIGTFFSEGEEETAYWVGGLVVGPYLIFSYFKHRSDENRNAVIEGKLYNNETYVLSKLEEDNIYIIGNHLAQLNLVPPIYAYLFISNLILTKYPSKIATILTLQKRKWSTKIAPESELATLSYSKNVYVYEEDLIGFANNWPDDIKGDVLLTTGYLYFFQKKSDFAGKVVDFVSDKAIENSVIYGLGWTAYTLTTDIKKDIEAIDHKLIKSLTERLHEKYTQIIDLRSIKKIEPVTKRKWINLIPMDLIGANITLNNGQTLAFFNKTKTTKAWSDQWLSKIRLALIPEGINCQF